MHTMVKTVCFCAYDPIYGTSLIFRVFFKKIKKKFLYFLIYPCTTFDIMSVFKNKEKVGINASVKGEAARERTGHPPQ